MGTARFESPPLRVLVVTTTYPRHAHDTTPRFVADLCEHLVADHGLRVTVVAPHAPGIARRETLRGVEVERFRYALRADRQSIAYGAGVRDNLRDLAAARRQLPGFLGALVAATARRLGDHDLVHAHWAQPGALVQLANLVHRRPTVLTLHRLNVPCSRIERFALARTDRVLFNSRFTLEQARRQGCRFAGEVAYQGFDQEVFGEDVERGVMRRRLSIPSGAPLVVAVARMVRFKGFHVLLEAADTFLEQEPGTHLVLAGDGPERAMLEERAKGSAHAARIHFPGPLERADVAHLLADADLFVNPGIDRPDGFVETLGIATLEAAAMGVPAVGTRVGGIPETIDPEHTGLLVDPEDPGQLAHAITALLAQPERLRAYSQAAREWAHQHFTWRALARQVVGVYRDLVGS